MKIIAHRCGTDRYPELTVAAARHSLAAGAAYVEMDVRFTADGVPVIHHDDTAAGLFGDPRRIAEMTLPEFLALRRQSDPAFCSHTMEDFLRCGVRQILYHVKQGGARLQPLLDLCGGSHAADGIRYLLIALFAGFLYPLTFRFWAKLGRGKPGTEEQTDKP